MEPDEAHPLPLSSPTLQKGLHGLDGEMLQRQNSPLQYVHREAQSPNILSVTTYSVDRVAIDGLNVRDTKKGTGLAQLA